MLKYSLKVKGPIYSVASNEQAKQTIGLDINLYERPLLATSRVERLPIYEDARPYYAFVLSQRELLADKAKALLERTVPVARDLYDMWFLIKKYRLKLDAEVASKKMSEYGKHMHETLSMASLKTKIDEVGRIWDREMKRLIAQPPAYQEVAKLVKAALG